jgi:hypothetical protein
MNVLRDCDKRDGFAETSGQHSRNIVIFIILHELRCIR